MKVPTKIFFLRGGDDEGGDILERRSGKGRLCQYSGVAVYVLKVAGRGRNELIYISKRFKCKCGFETNSIYDKSFFGSRALELGAFQRGWTAG